MNRNDIKRILQKGHRASLAPNRKAALRERLIERIHEEAEETHAPIVSAEFPEHRNLQKSQRVIRSSRNYLYPVAGIIAAAGMAGVVAVTFGIGSRGAESGSTSGSSMSTASSASASSSSNASSNTSSTATSSSTTSNSSTNDHSSNSVTNSNSITKSAGTKSSTASGISHGSSARSTSPSNQAHINSQSTPSNSKLSEGTNGANHQASAQKGTSKTSAASNGAMAPAAGFTSNDTTHSNGAMEQSNALIQPPRVIRTLSMVSSTVGWAIDSADNVLRTTDGGKTWTDVTPSTKSLDRATSNGNKARPSNSVDFSTGEVMAFAAAKTSSSQAIYWTSDGGKSWSHSQITVPANSAVQQIQILNAKSGFVVVQSTATNGAFYLYQTNDGGKSWHLISSSRTSLPNPSFTPSAVVRFTTAETGWRLAKSDQGQTIVETTANGGKSWKTWSDNLDVPKDLSQSAPIFNTLPTFFGQDGIWAIPYRNGTATDVVVYTSANQGASWQAGSPVVVKTTNSTVDFPTASVGWIIDTVKGQFHVTTDGGKTWRTVRIPAAVQHADKFDFTDASHGFAMITSSNQVSIYVTDNGGKTWTLQPSTFVDAQGNP